MEYKTLEMQYGHADGHTSVCYSTEGSDIFTCGSDGDVRIWTSQKDGDPKSECVGEMAIALAYYKDHFYVGSDTNYVQAYTFPEVNRDGIVSRFTAPVTHIAISQDGSLIAAGSCDMEIQVADVENSNSITKMTGHKAPVTGVAIDPLAKYLASSSCDGSVHIWDLKTGDTIKKLPDLFPQCNDFFRVLVLGRPSWQGPSGDLLAIPTGKKISLYARDSWILAFQLTDPKVLGNFSLAEYSPDGRYLAAASTSGEVIVWDVNSQISVVSYIHPKKMAISGISWRPDGQAIAICDRLGQFAVFDKILDEAARALPPQLSPSVADVGDEDGVSLEEIKRSAGWGSPRKADDTSSVSENESTGVAGPRSAIPVNLQPPFQPSSTPIHFQHRYMVWNAIGTVRCFNTEDEKSIDVEFHDTMFHHVLHISNYENYVVAALSTKVLALASTTPEDSPSKLTCVLLNAWDGSKEWTVAMPDGEDVTAVAASGKWVAVSTNLSHLRIFSSSGNQRQPISVPGPVVCLVGHEKKLGVIYHQGLGVPDSQNMAVALYEVHDLFLRTIVSCHPLPLPPGSSLKWAGFSDEGRLCTFDSTGVLRCLGPDLKHWVVLANTRSQSKGPSDNYFVIGVSERYQNIRCVLCKGSYYPMTTPRPTVVEIPLKIPLCDPDSEKSTLEETFWRLMCHLPSLEEVSQVNDDYLSDCTTMEKMLKQTVIKLFANACKGDSELRATDIAALMSDQPLQMAVKYASKCGKIHLAEKLNELTPVDWAEMRQMSSLYSHILMPSNQTEINLRGDATDTNGCPPAASQRDIFEDTQAENRLLQVENHESSLNMTLTPSIKNPFKVKEKVGTGPKGLSFFDKPVPQKIIKNEPPRNPALMKKVVKPVKSYKSLENNPKKKTFIQWFDANKTSMSQEFPELSLSELTKKGMARFRQDIASSVSDSQDSEECSELQITETRKRKLDVEHSPEGAKKVADNKLSAFAFHSSS